MPTQPPVRDDVAQALADAEAAEREAADLAGHLAALDAARARLAVRYGAARAAWVARALEPANPADRPAAPLSDGQPLPKPPQFPDVPRRAGPWTRPPLARALPDCWAVLGYRGKDRVLTAGG